MTLPLAVSTPEEREGDVRYQYFLKSDAAMSSDHNNWDTQHGACMSTQYDDAVILSPADTVTRCNVLCVGFFVACHFSGESVGSGRTEQRHE